jgi:hypothetical protein
MARKRLYGPFALQGMAILGVCWLIRIPRAFGIFDESSIEK